MNVLAIRDFPTIRAVRHPEGYPDAAGSDVSVANVRVDHEVKMADFERWLEKPGRSPREVVERQRIRAILGMEVPR